MRVLALDPGLTFGFGAVGGALPVSSGSHRLDGNARELGLAGVHFEKLIAGIITQETPDLLAYAAPFVGSNKGRPVMPDQIRPLMSFITIFEMIGAKRGIRCVEVDEPEARRAFLTAVPRKSKAIKLAVQRACFARGWPCRDSHAGDALCVAAWALECEAPEKSHETTPLFAGENNGSK